MLLLLYLTAVRQLHRLQPSVTLEDDRDRCVGKDVVVLYRTSALLEFT
jgi:hypothetical protein